MTLSDTITASENLFDRNNQRVLRINKISNGKKRKRRNFEYDGGKLRGYYQKGISVSPEKMKRVMDGYEHLITNGQYDIARMREKKRRYPYTWLNRAIYKVIMEVSKDKALKIAEDFKDRHFCRELVMEWRHNI